MLTENFIKETVLDLEKLPMKCDFTSKMIIDIKNILEIIEWQATVLLWFFHLFTFT